MKILIVKTSSLGDIIHTFPALGYLRKKMPHAQIDWIVEAPYAPLLEAHPEVNGLYKIQTQAWRKGRSWGAFWEVRRSLRQEKYDVVFDLQGNAKSALMTLQARAKDKVGFSFGAVPEWLNLLVTNRKLCPPSGHNIREDYLYLVQKYFEEYSPFEDVGIALRIDSEQQKLISGILSRPELQVAKRVLVCPGSAWPNKQLTTTALITLLKRLHEQHRSCFLLAWGNDVDRSRAAEIQRAFPAHSFLLDKLDLPTLQNLMSHLDLVIAMDSLPLHLAGTTDTATLSIFGPSSSMKYSPLGPRHSASQGPCPYGRTFEKRCPLLRSCPTGACMRDLSGEEIKM